MILIIVTLVYDFRIAASGVGPISGGIVALLITIDKLNELNLSYLIVLPALVQGLQGVIGLPLSSTIMKRYGAHFLEKNAKHLQQSSQVEVEIKTSTVHNLHDKLHIIQYNTMILYLLFVFDILIF